jgi:proline-specific peptidase
MRVIAFDNRGAGKSSRPDYPYTMEMLVDDTKALLDHLSIQNGIHLCGFSMGGMIAQKFTLKYPEMVKTLILLATGAYTEPIKFNQTLEFYKRFEKMTLEQKLNLVIPLIYTNSFKRKLKRDRDLFDKVKEDMNPIVHSKDPPRINDYLNQGEALADFDTRESLNEITIPTLIAVGEKDLNSSPEKSQQLHNLIPHSTLKIFEKVKHGCIIEAPEKVNSLMGEFLKKHIE